MEKTIATVPYFNNIVILNRSINVVDVIENNLQQEGLIINNLKSVFEEKIEEYIDIIFRTNKNITINEIMYLRNEKKLVIVSDKPLNLAEYNDFRNSNVYYREENGTIEQIINGVTFLNEDYLSEYTTLKEVNDVYTEIRKKYNWYEDMRYIRSLSSSEIYNKKDIFIGFILTESSNNSKLTVRVVDLSNKGNVKARFSYIVEKKEEQLVLTNNYSIEDIEGFVNVSKCDYYDKKFSDFFSYHFGNIVLENYELIYKIAGTNTKFEPIIASNYKAQIFFESVLELSCNEFRIVGSSKRPSILKKNKIQLTCEEEEALLENTIIDIKKCPIFLQNQIIEVRQQKNKDAIVEDKKQKSLIYKRG